MDMDRTIFFISPIGMKDSVERRHSDRMLTEVLRPVAEELELEVVRGDDAGDDPEKIEDIYKYIAQSRILVADLFGLNANVLHEVGIALAWGIAPIYIAPEGTRGLPFDVQHQTHIPYGAEIDGKNNSYIQDSLRSNLKHKLEKALRDPEILRYKRTLAYFQQQEGLAQRVESVGKSVAEKLEGAEFSLGKKVDRMDTDLSGRLDKIEAGIAEIFSRIERGEQSFNAVFIDGEIPAFAALTDAINRAQTSVKTTRFSPYSVVRRHEAFFSAIQSATVRLRDGLQRILAVNSDEKLEEAIQLVTHNVGKNLTVVFTKVEYSFEIVVIDDSEAFIHFRRADKPDTLIASTLHVKESKVASEFSVIFDQIVKTNSIETVDCKKLGYGDISTVTGRVVNVFNGRGMDQS